jgi:Lyzozyme M1 (1,4-beta-N-acetylmuramidase)
MQRKNRNGKREKITEALRKLFADRRFILAVICMCVALMIVSIFSIIRSIRIMRWHAMTAIEEPAADATPDPYFVPTPEPAETPVWTPPPTPEPTPEPSPFGWKEGDGYRYYLLNNGSALTGLHLIGGKLYYFNQFGHCASSLGVDVSYHNKGINWDAVRAQGIDFAIVRLGYRGWETGLLHDDVCFEQNLRGAKAAGLRVGVYIYSTAVNAQEAAEEASLVLSRLNGFPLDLPVYFDTEQSGEYPWGRADRLSKTRRYEIVSSFCRAIEAGGYRVGVYSGQNYLKNHVAFHTLAPNPVWLASYTRYNKLPDFPYAYDMWQFTDRSVVSGIRGVADMNAVY